MSNPARQKIERVLTDDAGAGVIRHVYAGCAIAASLRRRGTQPRRGCEMDLKECDPGGWGAIPRVFVFLDSRATTIRC